MTSLIPESLSGNKSYRSDFKNMHCGLDGKFTKNIKVKGIQILWGPHILLLRVSFCIVS